MRIDGSVMVITGASSGIGAATARAAAARGAKVVLGARRAGRLQELVGELPGAIGVRTDVTSRADLDGLVRAALDAHGRAALDGAPRMSFRAPTGPVS